MKISFTDRCSRRFQNCSEDRLTGRRSETVPFLNCVICPFDDMMTLLLRGRVSDLYLLTVPRGRWLTCVRTRDVTFNLDLMPAWFYV